MVNQLLPTQNLRHCLVRLFLIFAVNLSEVGTTEGELTLDALSTQHKAIHLNHILTL